MIPIGARPSFLNLKIWHIRCEKCGTIRWPKLPFAKGKKRHTGRFAQFAIDLLHWMTISGAVRVLAVRWDLIKVLHKDYLHNKYQAPPLNDLKYLAIVEFSIRKGHCYMTILLDLESGCILHAIEGRGGIFNLS